MELNDSFLRVIHEGLSTDEVIDLVRMGQQLNANDEEKTFHALLSITIEVDVPDRDTAREAVQEWIRNELPWHYAEYTLNILDIPEGWDSA